MSHGQIAAKVAEYFGVDAAEPQSILIERPVIIGTFSPKHGWSPINGRLATVAEFRALKRAGRTAVEVHYAGRTADFTPDEVIAYAERPLLGGRVI